jgi:hypothetical protein
MMRVIDPLTVGADHPDAITVSGIRQFLLEFCTVFSRLSKSPGYDNSRLDTR